MSKKEMLVSNHSSEREQTSRENFYNIFKNCPIPKNEILQNLGLFTNRQALSRVLFMHKLYKKIINVHGIIIEFGVM